MTSIPATAPTALDLAMDRATAADRALRRLREGGRAPDRALAYAEAECNRCWSVVGELDRPDAALCDVDRLERVAVGERNVA